MKRQDETSEFVSFPSSIADAYIITLAIAVAINEGSSLFPKPTFHITVFFFECVGMNLDILTLYASLSQFP